MIEYLVYRLFVAHDELGPLTRTVFAEVRCEQCRESYGYALTRTVEIEGDRGRFENTQRARERIVEEAERKLDLVLESERDFVPCPYCGWVQKEMLEAARRERYPRRISWSAALAFMIAGVCFVLMVLTWGMPGRQRLAEGLAISAGLLGCCGAIAHGLQEVHRWWYDPNAGSVEWRIERGLERALTFEEFQALHATEEETRAEQ